MYWFLAVIFGIAWGVGASFALMAILLNKSNNIGDSRDDIEKYGLGVTVTSSEDLGAISPGPIIDSYCEATMAMFTHDKSMIEFSNHKLSVVPERPLERYVPKPEDQIEKETVKKILEELKEEGLPNMTEPSSGSEPTPGLVNGRSGGILGSLGAAGAAGAAALGGAAGAAGVAGAAGGAAGSKGRPAPLWDAPKPKPEPQKEIFDPVEAEIAMMFGDDVPTGPIDPEAQQFLRPDAPVYEAPTANKPLWEAADPNDDFSDFEEDEF